jgi:glycosyltransferase involved in cell wall biosynthesis
MEAGVSKRAAPLVSIIIPCYNQGHFLREAIDSVHRQTYQDCEILVVNDGSTDDTSDVASSYADVRCINQNNQGLSAARNRGLRNSKGSLLVFLDADDRLLPHAIEVGETALRSHPECAFVYGHLSLIAADGLPLRTPQQVCVESNHCLELLKNDYIWTPGVVMYRRDVFESVIGFDTLIDACADCDLNIRIARNWPMFCHGQVILEYRKHGANMSKNAGIMLRTAIAAHRSQLRLVRGDKQLEEASKIGGRSAREYFGNRLMNQVRAHVSSRDWKRAGSGLLTLMRCYPKGIAESVFRKLFRVVWSTRKNG